MHRQRTEMALLRPLMLLSICSISAAAPQDVSENKTILTKPGGDAPPSVLNQQQNCIPDINSVLTDISVQVAKLEVEVKHLQRQNEEQSTTLKELEQQKCELEKLQQQDKQQQLLLQQQLQQLQQQQQQDKQQQQQQLQQQQQQLQQQQQQIQQQQQQDKQQQQQIQTQAAELVTMKTKANFTEKQVEALRKDREVRQVAFSTSLLTSAGGDTGPFNTHTKLIFKHVFENIGNAYNPLTGIFTAPVRGAYHFEFYIRGHTSPDLMAQLMKNRELICSAHESQTTGRSAASNGVTLLLEVGDVVFLRLPAKTKISDNPFHFTTFSGHLLFTM